MRATVGSWKNDDSGGNLSHSKLKNRNCETVFFLNF